MFPSVDDHPELGAPVADVIVPGDFVAEKLGDPRQGVAEDGAADVADMHRLGDVRRAEVDYDPARSFGARNAEPVVLQKLRRLRRESPRAQREVDEPSASNCRWLAPVGDIEMFDNFL